MIFRILWIKANIIYTQKHTHTFLCIHIDIFGLPWRLSGKNLPASAGDRGNMVQSLGQENPLEKEMATHLSILAYRTPWTEELGRLQSMGLQRVRHD